jgi:putative ABC transport system permease protein
VARLLNLFSRRRDRLERDLDRELRYHLERRVDDLIKAGLSGPEARRRARLEFGGMAQAQEAVRDTWIWRGLDALIRDARHARRSLVKNWGFALGAIVVLALAIGANVAMFSVVNRVLLRPLAYPDAERLVSVETLWTNTGRASQDVSGPDFLDWQAQNDVFEAMAVSYGGDDFAAIVGDRALFANARYVSADFFAVFGQTASAGRLLTERDVPAADATPAVVVVAYHWAVAHFGSDAAAVGKTITVYGDAMEIVGVAAPRFRYPGAADLWAPWRTTNGGTNRSLHNYRAVGKLKRDVDLARAKAQMRTLGDTLAQRHPENRLKTVILVPLQERLTGNLQTTLWVLMAAVGVVWLMACANIANLLLARAAARTREIALRAALGASRARVMRQLLTESCLLAAIAGFAGVLLASTLVQGVVASARLRAALVVTEVALSVILLVTAGLLMRSFLALQHVDLGFTTNRVLVAYTDYAVDTAMEIRIRSAFYADLLDRLRALPGVHAAAGIAYLPMGREPRSARDFFIQGRPEGHAGERPQAELYAITPDYFKTLEIPVRAGREFDRTDTPERPPVAIVNETLARTGFPGESPVGQRIRTNRQAPWMEIVGVVADTRWQDPSHPPPPVVFVSSTQGAGKSLSILARTSLDETSLASTLRTLLREANPTVPVRFETMRELFDVALAHPRFRTQVIGLFAGVSAVLAAVGIFSVLAYLVGQRTRELAVRRALGATSSDVIRLIVGQGLRLVAIGLVVGFAGALAVAQLLTGLLYEISPWDLGTYLGTIAVLGAAALVATCVPAIRAATISPIIALQQE